MKTACWTLFSDTKTKKGADPRPNSKIVLQCARGPQICSKNRNNIRGKIWHAASWPNQAVDTQTTCWTLHVSTGGHMCPRPLTTTCRRRRSLDTPRFAGHFMCPRGEQCVHRGEQSVHDSGQFCVTPGVVVHAQKKTPHGTNNCVLNINKTNLSLAGNSDTLNWNFDTKTHETAHCAYYAYFRHAAFEFRHQDT